MKASEICCVEFGQATVVGFGIISKTNFKNKTSMFLAGFGSTCWNSSAWFGAFLPHCSVVRLSASKATTKMMPGCTGLDSAVLWRFNGRVRRQTPGGFYGTECRLRLGCGHLSFDALTFSTLMSVSFLMFFWVRQLSVSVLQIFRIELW